MKYRLFTKSELVHDKWSGGTTTQLYIFPEGSDYKTKNFDFRISTATVELEESDFTPLEGINRVIMSLSGKISLKHDENMPLELAPLQIHSFSGGSKTKSYGKCTDFNLMSTSGTKAEMSYWEISAENSITFVPQKSIIKVFFYVYNGDAIFQLDSDIINLDSGDFLAIDNPEAGEIAISSNKDTLIASVYVYA